VAFALLGIGLWLGGHALASGAMPHPWLWVVLLLGGAFLLQAMRLTRRFGDPGAWRRRPHTARSLALAVAGYGSIALAALIGGSTSFGHVAIVLGGVLLIVSELSKRVPD
jgi:phosphatidylglycerophosphate synthase